MTKVAIVTGASRGIGLAIAERLNAEGYRIATMSRGGPPEQYPIPPADLEFCTGSVAQAADRAELLHRTLARWGRIDVLVNNAGIGPRVRADLLEMTEQSFDEVLGVNLRGTFFLTQAVARAMIDRADDAYDAATPLGTIVTVSSISATTVSVNRGEYCMSKAALAMASSLFAARLATEGINVYEVRPGIIATDMTAGVQAKYDRLIEHDGIVPMRRWGQPSDVASVVHLLVCGQMPYSTGEVIHVDGGQHLPRL